MALKFKNYLKTLRTRRGISQSDLAQRLEMSRQAVHGIEAGSYMPSMDVATRIAQILNVPISILFTPEEANTPMQIPIALIADCNSNAHRDELGEQLQNICPSDTLQTVVRAREGACPRWDWDPQGERTDGKPGIAIMLQSQQQFDELPVRLRDHGCTSIDCGIGMDRFPTIAYFAADPKYARDRLPDSKISGTLVPPSAIDEIIMDQATADLVQRAMFDAHAEALAFSTKCYRILGQKEYGAHYAKMADDILKLRERLHDGYRVIRWSSDYALLSEGMLAAEARARNNQDMELAKQYFHARKSVENQAK